MSKGNTWENDILKLYFQAVPIAFLADNAGTTPLTDLYLSLHSADPGEGGDQTTNECAYTSYARVAVARTASAWGVTANAAANLALVTWPKCTGLTTTAAYFGIGRSSAGAGTLDYSGQLTSTLAISNNVQPEAAIGDIDVTED